MVASPERAAAMATSWLLQSRYASAMPGSGLIRPRTQRLGPKMNLAFDGWFRPVLLANGESRVRFLPSCPMASLFNRSSARLWRSSRNG